MMNYNKIDLKNNYGMSLVEILIVLSIMGVVSAGLMTIMNSFSQVIVQSRAAYDAMELKTLVNDVLYSDLSCSVTFKDPNSSTAFTFKKVDIDQPLSGEGIAITDLWLSNVDGTARTQSLVSSTDADKQLVGKLKVTSIKFSMDNGTGSNFPEGDTIDRGSIDVMYEVIGMTGNNVKTLKVPFWVKVNTNASGNSTFISCSKNRSDILGGGGGGASDGITFTATDILNSAESRNLKILYPSSLKVGGIFVHTNG
ncbi:MAG: type II secretion system protein, partial [Bdellovibrionales bacterium]|nr:type II secretion system protein [Bdellovibrionales bacterium]